MPGLTISILRERTVVQRGQPVTISGRVSLAGIGLPFAVRVNLEGPSFDPQVTSFETMSNPTGDYAVAVIAPQDGAYRVMSQALLPGATLPLIGSLLPALAESPSPPLAVGQPLNGDVIADGRRIPAPPPTSFEIQTPIQVGAPIVTVITPGVAAAPAPTPFVLVGVDRGVPGPPPPPTIITTMLPVAPEVEVEAPAPAVGGQVVGFRLE